MGYYFPDIECPYCEEGFNLDHDDGAYYDENGGVQATCPECDKNFIVHSSMSWSFEGSKADCLNGSEHAWSNWNTLWKGEKDEHLNQFYERRTCQDCDIEQTDWHKERLDTRKSERFDK